VIPFSLNLEKFQTRARTPVASDAPVTFLHLGRIVPRKRLDLLIEAFRLLTLERSGVKLLIVGKFAYAAGYRRLLDPDHVPPGVEYLESVPREHVCKLFEMADVLVQPSENEDFGSAVMEAQGSGVPVVVGPSNGTAEYVGERSFKFSAYTAESIRDALLRAVDAVRADRVALTEDSRRAAEKHFRPEDVAEKLIAVVREVGSNAKSACLQPVNGHP
jgi:glycosyltransferase involved in cell wall biosynthesis